MVENEEPDTVTLQGRLMLIRIDHRARGYPARIVCLTEETTETLYLLQEYWRIVDISGFTVRLPGAFVGADQRAAL